MVQGLAYFVLILAGLARAAALAWPTAAWVPPTLQYGEPSWLLSAVGFGLAFIGLRITLPSGGSWWHLWGRATVFVAVTCLATWHWVTYSMHVFGGLPLLAAWAAATALAVFLALQSGLMLAFAAKGMQGRSAGVSALIFAAGWLLHEWVLTSWWSGFPWGESAMPWLNVAGHWPSWLGSGIAGAMLAGLFAWLVSVWMQPRISIWRRGMPVLIIVLLVWPFGHLQTFDFTQAGKKTSVALLQTQVRQDVKFDEQAGLKPLLSWVAQSLRTIDAEVVVWPETAIPLMSNDPRVSLLHAQALSRMPSHQAWVVGLPVTQPETKHDAGVAPSTNPSHGSDGAPYFNAVQWWHAGQAGPMQAPWYAKAHLVPFGEFVPFGFRWFVDAMSIPMSDFSSGGLTQAPIEWAGQRWASTICYEDLFGVELARRMGTMSNLPTVWLNHSNLAWFGPGVAPYQHAQIARWRATELGRPMVRSTNTGMTAVIDHQGRVLDQLEPQARAVLVSSVQGRTGMTPYVRWINWPWVWEGVLAASALLVLVAWADRMQRLK